jgi:iron complex outermembrane receptor protein
MRFAWKATPERLFWGAVSRAVRAPSRIDREFYVPGNPPFLYAGGPDFRSEIANVAEIGYREQLAAVSWSLTAYYRDGDRLLSREPTPEGFQVQNRIDDTTTGLEAWGTWRVLKSWRLTAGMVQQNKKLELENGSMSLGGTAALGNDPNNWWMLRSLLDITPLHEFDVMLRRVGSLASPHVPAYIAVDARFGWQVLDSLEFSVTGNNLVDPHHPEWGASPSRAELDRSVFAELLWRI